MADGEVSQIEYRVRHKFGGWVWLLSYDTVFERDDAGTVLRHIGVATDITAQKAAEERALAEKRAADAANEELRTFAYSVSHDLKSPSNTLDLILGEIQSVHGAALPDDAAELLELGQQTVHRMQALIEDVLSYTRVVGESITLEPLVLSDVVAAVIEDNRGLIAETGAEIDLGPLPLIAGHATQIRVLFQNLIGNAVKYRAPGACPRVSVSDTTRPGESRVSVTVKDDGIGIPVDKQDRIFSMFQRLHRQEEYTGTGLGLAICKRIATAHGGEISVVSSPGAGAAFTVTLGRP
jgi:signal transduction histidine kinase